MPDMRRKLLAANWKCNLHWDDCEAYARELGSLLPNYFDGSAAADADAELLLCPALPYVAVLAHTLQDSRVMLGTQDVSAGEEGAHTGEVSAAMIADIGCDYCIVGHSERRAAGESDEEVAAKLRQIAAAELIPILCVGESLDIRNAGLATTFVTDQLNAVHEELGQFSADTLVIAYEPIWAIGTGRNAEPLDAQAMSAHIREWLATLSALHAEQVQVLYGGSVNPENIGSYVQQPDIDGALIGGASLKAQQMATMVQVVNGKLGREGFEPSTK